HFSSNWTSRVAGGKSHEFVVELLGVVAGEQGVAADGVLVDAGEPAGLADADALGEVAEDVEDLVGRQAGVEQRRALAPGEARPAGAAVQQAEVLRPVVAADGEVAVPALAVVGAIRVLAAEWREVVHGIQEPRSTGWSVSCNCCRKKEISVQCCPDTTQKSDGKIPAQGNKDPLALFDNH